jgi:hypothetical protein
MKGVVLPGPIGPVRPQADTCLRVQRYGICLNTSGRGPELHVVVIVVSPRANGNCALLNGCNQGQRVVVGAGLRRLQK